MVTYDPYSSDSGSDTCDGAPTGDGSDTGGTGTGTYFDPGDYTGGQTVDFGTGEGSGNPSQCGLAAVVEYVCIDVWDPEGHWTEWACGFVTSC
jgi:hypothetical protein